MNELREQLTAFSDRLGIPADIMTGLPVLEMIGNHAVSIERQRGITSYSEEQVSVRVSIGELRLRGEHLRIRRMDRSRIVLVGTVSEIRLERSAP